MHLVEALEIQNEGVFCEKHLTRNVFSSFFLNLPTVV